MGYLVLSECLVVEMQNEKYVADIHSPVLEQLTLLNLSKWDIVPVYPENEGDLFKTAQS